MLLFNDAELAARFVPAMAGLGLVLMTAWFGRTMVSVDVGVVAGMRGEELRATVVGKTYDARFMLHGLAQHVAYHAGQIALLAKTGPEVARGLLRHTLAVLAYRGGKVLRDSPEGFADFVERGFR